MDAARERHRSATRPAAADPDTLAETIGALPGVWADGELDRLREEWDRDASTPLIG